MLTALDHVIIGVRDLEQATNIFRQQLGLVASGGGIHPTGGTANRIIVIGETYIELIAVYEPAEAQQSMLARLAKGEGYLNFVIASQDIAADSAAIVARKNKLFGPKAGELRSADGRSRAWIRADIEQPDLTQRYPFLIQHDSSGEERRFRLAGWSTPPEHPLGATKILSTTIVVADLDEATQRFQRIYGLEPSNTFSGERDSWPAKLVSFQLPQSQQRFELATPINQDQATNTTARLLEPGALAHYLQQFGESLCRITLAVKSLVAARQYLDQRGISYTYRSEPQPIVWIDPDEACGATLVLQEH